MRIVRGMEQRSREWRLWRAAGIGSSDAGYVMGTCKWRSRASVLREKRDAWHRGRLPIDEDNPRMARGRELEPLVVAWHDSFYGCSSEPLCAEHDAWFFLRASFDGWIASLGMPLEVKCPKDEYHEMALGGEVPPHYRTQCDHQLLVSGAPRMRYLSHTDTMGKAKAYAVVVVERDERRIADLLAAERSFWDEVLAEAEPPRRRRSPRAR